MKFTKKNIVTTVLIISILMLPFLLLLNPVLAKFQKRNINTHKKLIKKREEGEDVSQKRENLKYWQRKLGDVYRYTFREKKATEAYEKYLKWFRDSWRSKTYLKVKYRTATLYMSMAQGGMNVKENKEKATCHFAQIEDWYEDEGSQYNEIRKKSRRAISSYKLDRYMGNCD